MIEPDNDKDALDNAVLVNAIPGEGMDPEGTFAANKAETVC